MRRVLITSGVLGLGTALVFAAAGLTATLFPNGRMVAGNMNGIMMNNVMIGAGKPMIGGGFAPAPAIAVPEPNATQPPGVVVDDGSENTAPDASPVPGASD